MIFLGRNLLFILLFFCSQSIYAQLVSSAEIKLSAVLQNSGLLPKELLGTKTLVIISLSEESGDGVRGDWKSIAQESHFYFGKLGIDPVLYIYIDDLLSGYDVKRAITNQFLNRGISNIFMLSKDLVGGRSQYIGVLTAFNNQPTFIAKNQPSWKSQTTDLEILFRNLARDIDAKDLVRSNFLILDTPEFFRGVQIRKGRRDEDFNTDLRIDRIAIPIFEDVAVGENSSSDGASAAIVAENSRNVQRNADLEAIMNQYPYEYKIIPYNYDEKKLLAQGCQFILMRLTSTGHNIKRLLGYKAGDKTGTYTSYAVDSFGNSVQKEIPAGATVTKYYIKHINSGDIYLGQQWDADVTWQKAMTNHFQLLMRELEKKN